MTDATPLLRSFIAVPLVRSFIAVPLSGAVQTEIAQAARELALELPAGDVKWSRKPENLHITVKFLGPVAAERLEALGAALDVALADFGPFGLVIRGFGAFPSGERAHVVYASVDGAHGRMAVLAGIVDEVALRFGFERERRGFTAHVTVGRSKQGVDARAALALRAERALGSVEVDEVHVYESRLGGEGSTYVLRHRARLSAPAN
jgi:2'-5' RNA ligase